MVEAIARGKQKWNWISSRIGKQTSALSRPPSWLLEMVVVYRMVPLTEYPKPNPKRKHYPLIEWHRASTTTRGPSSKRPADSS